ncbi:MAG: permease [Candidatus Riflebacteria bacterium]|nr:permease [Candidatus Riflebacteria bacterium]
MDIATATPLLESAFRAGVAEVGEFLGTHLISGMIPAFFIAGAIAVFLEKQRITRLMGRNASPWMAYPVASFSGALLTVCSCGVLPIFTGIRQQGAGIGPAFTFLFSAPAVNLISLTYTYTYMGTKVMVARLISVLICSIAIGMCMKAIFGEDPPGPDATAVHVMADDEGRTDGQQIIFFATLVLIMVTSTGMFDSIIAQIVPASLFAVIAPNLAVPLSRIIPKLVLIFCEIGIIFVMLKKWFHPDEVTQWLKKSWSLFLMIFPKVLLGIFISGLLAAIFPLARFMAWFDTNTMKSNLTVAFIGAMMYFGTIVGVNIVSTMTRFGMHIGPALTLLLSGPAMSLPELMVLIPLVGPRKAFTYLALVVVMTASCGMIFGML